MLRFRRASLAFFASVACLGLPFAALAQTPAEQWPPAPPLKVEAKAAAGNMPPTIIAQPTNNGTFAVRFNFKPGERVKSVNLAGSFNGWNAQALLMAGPNGEGAYTADLELGPGDYQYKFVIDGTKWVHDVTNPGKQPDGHDGFNSIMRLGELAGMTESTEKVGDGKLNSIGLGHDNRLPMYFQALEMDQLLVRYRTLAHDAAKVSVAVKGGGLTELTPESEGSVFAMWEAIVKLPRSDAKERTVEYTFVIEDGAAKGSDPQTYTAKLSQATLFRTPEWARNAIWYQIMPDRFRNGDPSNDPTPVRPWTSEWFTASDFETKTGETFYKNFVYRRMYGGDIKGVEDKLQYLKDLGVTAIYFNPVFQADTHHKYNATNYLHIDEHLGKKGDYEAAAATEDLNDPKTWKWTDSDKQFLAFVKKAKSMGFRVIIDGVFNHVGVLHPAFQDVKKNGKASKYADWFDVKNWEPFEYNGWFGVQDLPVFKKSENGFASEQVKQHIFNVTRRWMDPNGDGDPSDGIDGWRLDVPNEVPAPFWVEWRQVVKGINPDAYIVGEIWDRADMWLDGRHFDAVMNYQFAQNLIAWIGHKTKKLKVSVFDRRLAELRRVYPAAATYVMQNLTDSHDTDRLVSMIQNPDRAYDHANRVQDNNPQYDNNKPGPDAYQRARLIELVKMTYVGAPMVYYGDEVGMWGSDDPTCRKPMLWEDLQPYDRPEENFVMKDQLEFYRKAIALRNQNPALRTGLFHTLLTDDANDVWAFERRSDEQTLVVIINASATPRDVTVAMPGDPAGGWVVIWGDGGTLKASGGKVTLKVPAVSGAVMKAAK